MVPGEQEGWSLILPVPLRHGPAFGPDVSRHRPARSIADGDGGGGLTRQSLPRTSRSGARRARTSAFRTNLDGDADAELLSCRARMAILGGGRPRRSGGLRRSGRDAPQLGKTLNG